MAFRQTATSGQAGRNSIRDVNETCGEANAARPFNQVEELQADNDKLRAIVNEQNVELLSCYRRLMQQY